MLMLLRLLLPCGALGLFALILQSGGLPAAALFDLRTLSFVALVPWVALALVDHPGAALSALLQGLRGEACDLPYGRRLQSRTRLRSLSGMTLATGVIAACSAVVGGLNHAAFGAGESAGPAMSAVMGGALLGPVYALLLSGLLYAPLAILLEGANQGLGEELASDTEGYS